MNTTGAAYKVEDSNARIREILDAGDQCFEELDYIPSADKLTYTNGFYVNCTALFIDIRGSSKLPQMHTRPVLAKIYRAYLSECVAVLNQDPNCREVFINGDCVSGIFDTPLRRNIDFTFFRAAQLNTLLKLLNWRLEQKGYAHIECGIGLDYGRALMLKAGYKGHAINEIIWMGDVVNGASNLCHLGNKGSRKAIQISPVIQQNITREDYLELLAPVRGDGLILSDPTSYEGDLVSVEMNNWIEEEQAKYKPRERTLTDILFGDSRTSAPGTTLLTSDALAKVPSKSLWD
jgi:class 3 adenylate cyclase